MLCIVTLCGNIHLSTPLDHKIIWPGSSLNGSTHRQGKTNKWQWKNDGRKGGKKSLLKNIDQPLDKALLLFPLVKLQNYISVVKALRVILILERDWNTWETDKCSAAVFLWWNSTWYWTWTSPLLLQNTAALKV